MKDSLRKQLLDAILVVVRPIVRILLRYDIGVRDFVEIAKVAYVDVATNDFGIRGRPTNISRVAVMTGLTRKEVRRLRNMIGAGEKITVKSTPITDVLHHWHAEPEFTNEDGRPRTLPFNGEKGSFASLVRRFGGDIPAGAMRTEMKRVGVVMENEDKSLTVVNRAVRPCADHDNLITSLIHSAYPMLANVAHNSDPGLEGETWTNRVVHTQRIDPQINGRLRRIARDRIIDFAESIDDVFMSYEDLGSDSDSDQLKQPIAVGVFYFEERDEAAKYNW